MSLTLGDNFSYQGSKPLDARLKYDTLANMKAVGDATMYEGCIAYCVATDKTYQWKSGNTVDADTGKWREFEAGGGGSTYTAGTGISIANDEIAIKEMTSGDMDDVVTPTPSPGGGGGGANPTGTIISFLGITAPSGYLICDGTIYNIAEHSTLASFFETQFGTKNHFGGNGTTTFAVPDLRGEFLRGTGTNSHANQGSGANVGVHQDASEVVSQFVWDDSTGMCVFYPGQNGSHSSVIKPLNPDSEINGSQSGSSYLRGSNGSSSYVDYQKYTVRATNTSVLYCIKE